MRNTFLELDQGDPGGHGSKFSSRNYMARHRGDV